MLSRTCCFYPTAPSCFPLVEIGKGQTTIMTRSFHIFSEHTPGNRLVDKRCCGNKLSPTTYLFTNSSIVFTSVQSSFPATGQRLSSLRNVIFSFDSRYERIMAWLFSKAEVLETPELYKAEEWWRMDAGGRYPTANLCFVLCGMTMCPIAWCRKGP